MATQCQLRKGSLDSNTYKIEFVPDGKAQIGREVDGWVVEKVWDTLPDEYVAAKTREARRVRDHLQGDRR